MQSVFPRAHATMTAAPQGQTGQANPPRPWAAAAIPRADVTIAFVAFLVAVLATWVATGMLDVRFLTHETVDTWFEADIARVVESMSERWEDHYRAKVHPTFSLLVLPVVVGLREVFSLDTWTAIRIVMSVTAGLWVVGLYVALRLIVTRRVDAVVFTALGASSAGAMFWFTVPETHTLASLTVVLALIIVAMSFRHRVPVLVDVVVGAATLGVTVTNWMAGIIASWSTRPWRQAAQVCANAFALTVVLWVVAKKLTPSAPFFLGNAGESGFILTPESLGPIRIVTSFLVHTIVMPAIAIVDRPGAGTWPILAVQSSLPGSAGLMGLVSVVLWGAILVAGVCALWQVRTHRALRVFLGLFLAGQLALHLVYGNETFLYAPNFLPALLALVALGTLGPWRRVVVPAAMLLTVSNAANNGMQWKRANGFLADHAQYEHDVRAVRAARADDPWPEPAAFARVEMPGVRNLEVPYATAGGSFSPGIDQFTLSLWVRDTTGKRVYASDVSTEGPLLHESNDPDSSGHPPFYDIQWEPEGPRRFRMRIVTHDDERVSVVVRGVGARSAPVRRLTWAAGRLTINDRWVVEGDSSLAVALVDENVAGWQTAAGGATALTVPNGWAAARLEFTTPGAHTLVVRDLLPEGPIDRILGRIPARGGEGE